MSRTLPAISLRHLEVLITCPSAGVQQQEVQYAVNLQIMVGVDLSTGQYHWVSEFAPANLQKGLSYAVGMHDICEVLSNSQAKSSQGG